MKKKKRFPAITEDFRLAEENSLGGWKLVRKGSNTALFDSLRKAKNYIRNHKLDEFRIVLPSGEYLNDC